MNAHSDREGNAVGASDYEITYEEHKPGHGSYVVRSVWSGRVVWGPGTYSECERWIGGRS